MKVLIISPYFHPYENPRAYRWTQVANYLQTCGHDVHVLTSNDHNLGNEYRTINIYRVGNSTPDKAIFTNKSANRGSWVPDFIKTGIKRHLWPDESRLWIRPAFQKAIQICDMHDIDFLISVSLPFSSHCVAQRIKKINSLPWLADVGDPFELGKAHNKHRRRLEKEKSILNQCDAITVTTSSLASSYQSSLKNHSGRVSMIGPMSSPLVDESALIHSRTENDPIKLGYFGTFYRNVRDPDVLIHGINLLTKNWSQAKIEIHLYGDIKSLFLNQIQSQIHSERVRLISHTNVPRSEVICAMKEMDILLSVGNKSRNQIPSKVVDYVVSLRPILHFSYVPDDTVVEYLKANPLFIQFDPLNVSETSTTLFSILENDSHCENDHFTKVKKKSQPTHIGELYNQLITVTA